MLWRERLTAIAESPRDTLKLFGTGAALFFCGLGLLVYVDRSLTADLRSELLALLAILLMGGGFAIALFGQILFIRQRFR